MMSLIKNSLENLKSHKIRVSLTIFWIIIGITSILVVGSIGNGVKNQIEKSTQSISNNDIYIDFTPNDDAMHEYVEFMAPITQTDIETIKDMPEVEKVSSSNENIDYYYGEASVDTLKFNIELYGIDESGNDEFKDGYKIVYGRKFNESDRNKNVIILNREYLRDLNVEEQKLLGKGIKFNGLMYEVVGIMEGTDVENEFGYWEYNPLTYSSLVPKTTLNKLASMNQNISQTHSGLQIKVIKGYDIDEVSNKVLALLNKNHPNIDGEYELSDFDFNMTEEIKTMISSVNSFVLLVTGVAMLVGGIGVMNIMYVSVIERKREIGIRRAIGATPSKIIIQFLSESVFITVSGSLLGLIVGSIALKYVGTNMPFESIPTVILYIQAMISSVVTGVLAGLLPALKASKVDPIEAIQG